MRNAYTYNTTGGDVLYATPDDGYNTNSTVDGYYTVPQKRSSSSSSSYSSNSSSRYGNKQYGTQNHVVGQAVQDEGRRAGGGGDGSSTHSNNGSVHSSHNGYSHQNSYPGNHVNNNFVTKETSRRYQTWNGKHHHSNGILPLMTFY